MAAGAGAQTMYPVPQAGPAESIRALGASAFSGSAPCPAELSDSGFSLRFVLFHPLPMSISEGLECTLL